MPRLQSEFEEAKPLVQRYHDLDAALNFLMRDMIKIRDGKVENMREYAKESLRALPAFLDLK